MTVEQAKEKGYTHHAKLYGFDIYFRDHDSDVYPKTFIGEFFIDIMVFIEEFIGVNGTFPIKIISELLNYSNTC